MGNAVKDDGRGIVSGDWLNQNQDITYQTWLEDVACLWGNMMKAELLSSMYIPDRQCIQRSIISAIVPVSSTI